MNILIIGGGGREYAIAKRLAADPRAQRLYALPGNGGMAEFCECVPIKATDLEGVCDFARGHAIDYAVVTPDDPLALGMADALTELGVPCFGPKKAAARIEASKAFAKELMRKYSIPTAESRCFDEEKEAQEYASAHPLPLVVKADGLALGKGVFICRTHEEAAEAISELMSGARCGESGRRILIEEFLTGPEVSVLALTDGESLLPLPASMDHKTIGEGGVGPNTGGMGVIAPNPYYTGETAKTVMETIMLPTIRAMKAEGCPFTGCLYFGLMLTPAGPKVIEYNCRFGDPETQTVLPLLKTNLLDALMATNTPGGIAALEPEFGGGAVCCVVLASGGYPGAYRKGLPIEIDESAFDGESAMLVHAGTKSAEGGFVTSGGRVINVIAAADTLGEAVERAYELTDKVRFEGMYFRRDIGRM